MYSANESASLQFRKNLKKQRHVHSSLADYALKSGHSPMPTPYGNRAAFGSTRPGAFDYTRTRGSTAMPSGRYADFDIRSQRI